MTANPILLQKKYSRVIECFAEMVFQICTV